MRFATLATVLSATATFAYADTCYAAVFSSGDQTASYQAGVLKALAMGDSSRKYTAVSGISGGAVSAAILASYAPGQEIAAANRMLQFWDNAAHSKMYKNWLGGVAEGLLVKGGLYNNKPLNKFLESELSDIGEMQRQVNVGLADVLSGQWKDFDLSTNFLDVMEGSFSYAGFFPPAQSMDTEWFDGSSIWDLDAFSAVNKCLQTHDPKDIHVDVILTSEKHLKQVDPSDYHTLDMLWRYLHVSRYYNQMDGLLRAQFAYPDVNFCVISPDKSLDDGFRPLSFKQKAVDKMFQQGIDDGTASLNECHENSKMHMQYYQLKKRNDKRVKGMDFATFKSEKAIGTFEDFEVRRPTKKGAKIGQKPYLQ